MCGIAGFWSPSTNAPQILALARTMGEQIDHRGPDDSGEWCDADAGYSVAHRRLSIIDISPSGHQPMTSHGGRWVIAYNGEIYNHDELRRQLETNGQHPEWRGHSDTEVLLACIERLGVETTLSRCVGMFAFALWDRENRRLILARDRFGEKPLYYGWQGESFLFGSELKALRKHQSFVGSIDRNALPLLLRHNCIPAPYSIYEGIHKLLPGHFLNISFEDRASAREINPTAYWTLASVVDAGLKNPFAGSDNDAIDILEKQLSESVRSQMMSDVPLGAFLSGGIDSSTIVALMQLNSDRPINTYTIGFHESNYDEAVDARRVASHLQTNHTELYVQPKDALDLIPLLPSVFCEPFSDSSQIPTFLVSSLSRSQVKVALSGDAGDELFGGYNRYLMAKTTWERVQKMPLLARRALAGILRSLHPNSWDTIFGLIKPLIPAHLHVATPGEKAQKLANVMAITNRRSYFQALTSHWTDPESIVLNSTEPRTLINSASELADSESFENWMMALDTRTFLTDDILVKVDRAAMANSLETRVPLLDHRVVELAWKMPLNMKIRNGQGKWLLRQVLNRHVPAEIFERPKMGFGVPLDSWLRGPLKDWGEALLNEQKLIDDGFFAAKPIRDMWHDHQSGKSNWQHHLWTVLMFQSWLENQKHS